MMKRKLLILFLVFLILPTVGLAYGVGMSPGDQTVCTVPGQVKNVTYYISKTSDYPIDYIFSSVSNISWAFVSEYLDVSEEKNMYQLNVTLYTPKVIEYGLRKGGVSVCLPPIAASGATLVPCVDNKLNVDVQETCPELEAKKAVLKNIITDVLMIIIFFLVLIYLCRTASKTKCRTKAEVRRIKRRKRVKRRKK